MARKTRAQRRALKAHKHKYHTPLTAVRLVFHPRAPERVIALVSSFIDSSINLELWKACQFNSLTLLDRLWDACTSPPQPSPADKGPGHKTGWQRRQYLRTDRFYGRHQFRLAMLEAVKLPGIDVARWLFSHFKGCVVPNEAVELACAKGRLDILQFWHDNGIATEVDVRAELRRARDPSIPAGSSLPGFAAMPGLANVPGVEVFARDGVLQDGLPVVLPESADDRLLQFINAGGGEEASGHRDLMQLLLNQALPSIDNQENQALLQYFRDGTPPTDPAASRSLESTLGGAILTVVNDNGEVGFMTVAPQAFEDEDEQMQPEEDPDKHQVRWGWNDVAKAVESKQKAVVRWLDEHTYADRDLYMLLKDSATAGDVEFLDFLDRNYHSVNAVDGILSTAVAAGQIGVMKWLYHLGYKRDGDVAMVQACEQGRLDLARWLLQHKYTEAGLAIDYAAVNGHLDMARELHTQYWPCILQCKSYPLDHPPQRPKHFTGWLTYLTVMEAAVKGNLAVVQWLVETFRDEPLVDVFTAINERGSSSFRDGRKLPIMEVIASKGHLSVLKYLLDVGMDCPPFSTESMDQAASDDHLEMVKWLTANRLGGCTKLAMDLAASEGHLEMVRWLHTDRSEGCTTQAMDRAAAHGHLDTVKWLHSNRSEGCTTEAMDHAAQNGHLDVIKWLHGNRFEGSTTKAMDYAARGGHLSVVQWLHSNRSEGCTTAAMDGAAQEGHLDIVQWLHENRKEGCTVGAMDGAARGGHRDVVYWLHKNRSEGCSSDAMDNAAMCGDFELVLFFHSEFEEGCTDHAFDMPDEKNKFPRSNGMRPDDIYAWLNEYYPPAAAN